MTNSFVLVRPWLVIWIVIVILAFPFSAYFRTHLKYPLSKGMPTYGSWKRTGIQLDTTNDVAMNLLTAALNELGTRTPIREGNLASVVVGNPWIRSPWSFVMNIIGTAEPQPDGKQNVTIAARPRLSIGAGVFHYGKSTELLQQASDSILARASEHGITAYILGVVPPRTPSS